MGSPTDMLAPFSKDVVSANKENDFSDLDPIRQAFCIAYVQNGYRHRAAAEDVGLDPNKGIAMKREPLCAAYISVLQTKFIAEASVTREMLDARLDIIEDIAMGYVDVPVMTAMGRVVEVKKFHPDLVMGVYRERAKLHNFTEEENKITPVNVTVNIGAMVGAARPRPEDYDNNGLLIEQVSE